MAVGRLEQQLNSLKLLLNKGSEPTAIKSFRKLFSEYYDDLKSIRTILREIGAYKPSFIQVVLKYEEDNQLANNPSSKNVRELVVEIQKDYDKRLNDLKNSAKQGHSSVEKLRASLLADFPERKNKIDAAIQAAKSTAPSKTVGVVPAPVKVAPPSSANKALEADGDTTRLIFFNVKLDLFRDCVEAGGLDVESWREELLKEYPDKAKEIEAAYMRRAAALVSTENNQGAAVPVQSEIAARDLSKEQTSSVAASSPSRDEAYKGKQYCSCNYKTFRIQNLGSITSSAEGEVHPNCLTELRSSQKWTILIDETGTFKQNETTDGRVVGVFIPHNVCLKPCTIHAIESSFSKVEDAVLTLLNSRCGILGVSVDSLGYPSDNPWAACIKQLLKLAVFMLPYERRKKVEFEVKIERRSSFDEENDLRLLRSSVKDEIALLYPDFVQNYLDIDLSVVDKNFELIGYPDVVAYMWGSEHWSSLSDFTCWKGTCLIDKKSGASLRDAYGNIGVESSFTPLKWEALLASCDSSSPSILSVVLENYGKQALPAQTWNAYLLFLNQYALPNSDFDASLLFKEIQWLERYVPNENKPWNRKNLLTLCKLVSAKLLAGFENDDPRRDEFEQIKIRLQGGK